MFDRGGGADELILSLVEVIDHTQARLTQVAGQFDAEGGHRPTAPVPSPAGSAPAPTRG